MAYKQSLGGGFPYKPGLGGANIANLRGYVQSQNKGKPVAMRQAPPGAIRGAARQMGVQIPKFKKGGVVKKTGPAIVHKGERVIPANKRKMVEKMLKKKGVQSNYSK